MAGQVVSLQGIPPEIAAALKNGGQVPPQLAAALGAQQMPRKIARARDIDNVVNLLDAHLRVAHGLMDRVALTPDVLAEGVTSERAEQVAALKRYVDRLERVRAGLVSVHIDALAPTFDDVAADFERALETLLASRS